MRGGDVYTNKELCTGADPMPTKPDANKKGAPLFEGAPCCQILNDYLLILMLSIMSSTSLVLPKRSTILTPIGALKS